MRLIDCQVVDTRGLERNAGVFGRVQFRLQPFLGPQQRAFQALDGKPAAFLRRFDPGTQLGEFAVHVGALLTGRQRDALEG